MFIIESFDNNKNTVYIGSSAGAMIAGTDIELAYDFEDNNVHLTDLHALGLFDGCVIPHYEKEDLKRFINNSDRLVINKYRVILSVGDEEVLVINGMSKNIFLRL